MPNSIRAEQDRLRKMGCRCLAENAACSVESCPLHAAAPDLLEALKSWVSMENSANVSADRFDAIMKKARAAIARAEGRA